MGAVAFTQPMCSATARCAVPSAAVSRRRFTTWVIAATSGMRILETRAAEEPIELEEAPRLLDLGDGIRVEEISVGNGAQVVPGSVVSVRWVLRRSNGYFIDASYGFGRFDELVYTAGTGTVIPAFERVLLGMRAGGRRRFLCPPELGYVNGGVKVGAPGPIPPDSSARRAIRSHMRENLFFEVHTIKVRPSRT